jgi:hypothetical protein
VQLKHEVAEVAPEVDRNVPDGQPEQRHDELEQVTRCTCANWVCTVAFSVKSTVAQAFAVVRRSESIDIAAQTC